MMGLVPGGSVPLAVIIYCFFPLANQCTPPKTIPLLPSSNMAHLAIGLKETEEQMTSLPPTVPRVQPQVFAGRLGGNQRFAVSSSDPDHNEIVAKEPDAGRGSSWKALLDLRGFYDLDLWRLATIEGIANIHFRTADCWAYAYRHGDVRRPRLYGFTRRHRECLCDHLVHLCRRTNNRCAFQSSHRPGDILYEIVEFAARRSLHSISMYWGSRGSIPSPC
jgi:hypothetical protein